MIYKRYNITNTERGLLYREREFAGVLAPGKHYFVDPLNRVYVGIVSVLTPHLELKNPDMIAKSGLLGNEAMIVELKDKERGLVYVDERFDTIVGSGTSIFWTIAKKVRVEVIDATEPRFQRPDLDLILARAGTKYELDAYTVENGFAGLYFRDGKYVETLGPGTYAFWKNGTRVQVRMVDQRETTVDVAGQEILTADRVSLRLNAIVTYRIADPVLAITKVADAAQAFYRAVQLALRAVVGTRELDALLADKDGVLGELTSFVRPRAEELGIELVNLGIRDVILPGEMKVLLNKVVEAKKAAEASLITRREETAWIRSQANTAKVYETNPTLMRLRELETLEKLAEKATFNVVLGEGGLADRVVKLI